MRETALHRQRGQIPPSFGIGGDVGQPHTAAKPKPPEKLRKAKRPSEAPCAAAGRH
jgi:hypothetical protein